MTEAESTFNRRFLAYFAVFLVIASMIYIGAITFLVIPKENQRFADTVLGFLLGTLIGTIIAFFYGSTKSNQDKDQTIKGQLMPPPVAPLLGALVEPVVKIDTAVPVRVEEVPRA